MFWKAIVPSYEITRRVDSFQIIFARYAKLSVFRSTIGEQNGIVLVFERG